MISATFVKNEFAPVSYHYTTLETVCSCRILNSVVHFNWSMCMHITPIIMHVTFDLWPLNGHILCWKQHFKAVIGACHLYPFKCIIHTVNVCMCIVYGEGELKCLHYTCAHIPIHVEEVKRWTHVGRLHCHCALGSGRRNGCVYGWSFTAQNHCPLLSLVREWDK